MIEMLVQGDVVIERVEDARQSSEMSGESLDRMVVLPDETGLQPRRSLYGQVTIFRDDALARDIPRGLYVTHIRVLRASARLECDQHPPLVLKRGTYRLWRRLSQQETRVGNRESERL